jgi:hypothetical protein
LRRRSRRICGFLRVLVPTLGSIPADVTPLLALKTNSIFDDSHRRTGIRGVAAGDREPGKRAWPASNLMKINKKVGSVSAPLLPSQTALTLVAVQQHALGLLLADGAIEELVVFQVHLDEGGPLRERALDECL